MVLSLRGGGVGKVRFTAVEEAYAHAYSLPHEEVVGLVLSDGTIVRLTNQARSPHRFAVSQTQMAEALAEIDPDEVQVVAIYHSHPSTSTTPSLVDEQMMRDQKRDGIGLPWLILVPDGPWDLWEIDEEGELCLLS